MGTISTVKRAKTPKPAPGKSRLDLQVDTTLRERLDAKTRDLGQSLTVFVTRAIVRALEEDKAARRTA